MLRASDECGLIGVPEQAKLVTVVALNMTVCYGMC
jgi:hypothetical protein